jgi:hypothetical protein
MKFNKQFLMIKDTVTQKKYLPAKLSCQNPINYKKSQEGRPN